jgi:DNA-directed RNA polymerase specialized sigma subunit
MPQSSANSSDRTDEMLVRLFHEGDVEALDLLLERYRRFAGAKARGYFLAGGDNDDLQQEAMIGLFKASATSATVSRRSGPSPSCASPARS